MNNQENTREIKKAFSIGGVAILSYLMSYYMRNLLGVVNPTLLSLGTYDEIYLALLSSAYTIVYAAGQLVNGFIGDYLKPKYMVAAGYILGGTAMLLFPYMPHGALQIVCFAVLGFGFSMLRGPLVKTISENTLLSHARVCCTFFSFSCHFGPLLASLLSMLFHWDALFTFSGILAYATAAFAFIMLTVLEKKGAVRPLKKAADAEKKKGLADLLSVFTLPKFVVYMLIGMVVEIAATSITFWMTTYIHQYLNFSENESRMIFSAVTIIKSICPFFSLFFFKLFGENDVRVMRLMFAISTAMFVLMYFSPASKPILNLFFFLLALSSISIASAEMWSIYVPSLGKSGKVSGTNGVLDCSGYLGATAATSFFAWVKMSVEKSVGTAADGWRALILVWGAVALCGFVITLFASRKKHGSASEA